jgi:hypothetical protein
MKEYVLLLLGIIEFGVRFLTLGGAMC